MGSDNGITKKVLMFFFLMVVFIGFFKSGSYSLFQNFSDFLKQDPAKTDKTNEITMDEINDAFSKTMWQQQNLIDLNGYLAKQLGMKGYYSDIGIYVYDGDYIMSGSPDSTTDYEYEQMMQLKEFCDANGINLLYVNEPIKYTDDNDFSNAFGLESYSNRKADKLIKRMRESGISTIDLRENIENENKNIYDLFYRTDHHWKTTTAFWATKIIAEALNEYCGYSIDLSIYDPENFSFEEKKECWLGEQGRKIGKGYIGLEDFTIIRPKFETDYIFYKTSSQKVAGTFDEFIDDEVFDETKSVYDSKSWVYAYSQYNCTNNLIENGRVLILGDSYEQFTVPFLSLCVRDLRAIVMRSKADTFDFQDFVLRGKFDTIVVCYSQLMIGAHDNPKSANYKMYSFFPEEE